MSKPMKEWSESELMDEWLAAQRASGDPAYDEQVKLADKRCCEIEAEWDRREDAERIKGGAM